MALGWFDESAVAAGWHSDTAQAVKWFDHVLSASSAGETLSLSAGTFTLAGQDATFVRTYVTPAEAGAFTLAGQSAGFLFGTKLEAGAGAFVLSGQFLGFGLAPGSMFQSHRSSEVAIITILIP